MAIWYPVYKIESINEIKYPPLYYYPTDGTISLNNIYTPRAKKGGALDVSGAIKLLGSLVDAYNKQPSIKDTDQKIIFSDINDNRLFDSELKTEPNDTNRFVTWNLVKRGPGSRGPHPFTRPFELRPFLREITKIQYNNKNIVANIYGELKDNIIAFDCWAPSQSKVLDLAEEFEQLFDVNFKNNLMRAGVQRIIPQGQSEIKHITSNNMYHTRISYFFKTEKITITTSWPIKSISIESIINVADSLPVSVDMTLMT